MAKSVETTRSKRFREGLEAAGCYTEKTHGGIYSSGLPDLLVAVPPLFVNDATHPGRNLCLSPGLLVAVEAKVVRHRPPTVEAMFALLRPGTMKKPSRQRAVGLALARMVSPAVVLAFNESDDPDTPYAYVSAMSDILLRAGQPPANLHYGSEVPEFLAYVRALADPHSLGNLRQRLVDERRSAAYLKRVADADAEA